MTAYRSVLATQCPNIPSDFDKVMAGVDGQAPVLFLVKTYTLSTPGAPTNKCMFVMLSEAPRLASPAAAGNTCLATFDHAPPDVRANMKTVSTYRAPMAIVSSVIATTCPKNDSPVF